MADRVAAYRLGLVLSAVIGAALSVLVGYFADAMTADAEGASRFSYWFSHPLYNGVVWWALFGAVVGPGLVSVRTLTSRP